MDDTTSPILTLVGIPLALVIVGVCGAAIITLLLQIPHHEEPRELTDGTALTCTFREDGGITNRKPQQ